MGKSKALYFDLCVPKNKFDRLVQKGEDYIICPTSHKYHEDDIILLHSKDNKYLTIKRTTERILNLQKYSIVQLKRD